MSNTYNQINVETRNSIELTNSPIHRNNSGGTSVINEEIKTDIEDLTLTSISKKNKLINHENNVEFKNKLISIFFHVFLMSSFEILFYFFFVIKIERQLFLDKILTYNREITHTLTANVSQQQSILISNVIHSTFNEQIIHDLYKNYKKDLHSQHTIFQKLLHRSLFITSMIGVMFSVVLFYGRREVKIKWVVFENFMLFLLLGIYEYTFFNLIILNYTPITDGEIQYIFVCNLLNNYNYTCHY